MMVCSRDPWPGNSLGVGGWAMVLPSATDPILHSFAHQAMPSRPFLLHLFYHGTPTAESKRRLKNLQIARCVSSF